MVVSLRNPARSPDRSAGGGAIPALHAGDRLSVEEFDRRYAALPEVKNAELIDGVVYMASPVTDTFYGSPHFDLSSWLGAFRFETPGVRGGDNSTLKALVGRNRFQPDLLLRIEAECGGLCRTDEEGYLLGVPELVAEIAYSSASYDLHDKMEAYRANGLPEYLVWRIEDPGVDWFRLRNGVFQRLEPDAAGVLRSEMFPGLWLDANALLKGDLARVKATLQAGLASPERRDFVGRLQASRSAGSEGSA